MHMYMYMHMYIVNITSLPFYTFFHVHSGEVEPRFLCGMIPSIQSTIETHTYYEKLDIKVRVVSSPSGINYFLGLSTFFEVIQRALKSCATLITRACACA